MGRAGRGRRHPRRDPEFLTGVREAPEPDRVLATVLFTDLVGSTEERPSSATAAGGSCSSPSRRSARQLKRFRGREIDTAGDGFLATLRRPGASDPLRHARSVDAVEELGLEIRRGLHTGECEVVGDKLAGVAVHIGARVASKAGPGEVLVSGTVHDLVAGSGIGLQDRGSTELKGVPGEWRLYAVSNDGS